jgi:hypothetical protein
LFRDGYAMAVASVALVEGHIMRESKFFVRVNLGALRGRIANQLQRARRTLDGTQSILVTNDDAFDWLTTHGFHLGRGGWFANATTLNRLHRTAIISLTRVR